MGRKDKIKQNRSIHPQQTRDGGFDLRIIENRSGEVYLVECKKYSNNNPIGIAVVRQMLGVQLLIGIHRAKIVTTSRFSKNAVVGAETAEKLNPKY